MDASQTKDAQPGEASATAANPEPALPEVTEAPAEPSDGTRRLKRARHRSGYYTDPVSYTHLRAHETGRNLVCRLLLEKKK